MKSLLCSVDISAHSLSFSGQQMSTQASKGCLAFTGIIGCERSGRKLLNGSGEVLPEAVGVMCGKENRGRDQGGS